MSRRPTSRDVAQRAGVSQSTVSFVLTGRPGISAATREKVLQAAAELNYRPNRAARSMRTRRSGRLAVIIPDAGYSPGGVLRGATAMAQEHGYVLEVVGLPVDPSQRRDRLEELVASGDYEGVLAFTPLGPAAPAVPEDGPVLLLLAEFDESLHATGVLTDAGPVVEIMEHLVRLGHRRFLHIAGRLDFPSAVARREAYLAQIARHGVEDLGVRPSRWDAASGFAAIESLPASAPPLAVIAGNDVIATGAIRAAVLRGWSIPGDMSITGWDDRDTSAYLVPSLTTVRDDRELLGSRSMLRLIEAVRRRADPPPDAAGTEPGPATGIDPPADAPASSPPSGILQTVIWRESVGPPA